jgi:hypothetical protein
MATQLIELPEGIWTDITSLLTTGTTYSVQCLKQGGVMVIEATETPSQSAIGVIMTGHEMFNIRRVSGSEYYSKPLRGVGAVLVTRAY